MSCASHSSLTQCNSAASWPSTSVSNPMKTRMQLLLVTAAMLVIAVLPLRAQLVADGATKTLNGGITNIVGDVVVGTNGSFTLLVLTN